MKEKIEKFLEYFNTITKEESDFIESILYRKIFGNLRLIWTGKAVILSNKTN